ncbi:MAG: 3-dehydroquinate synthase [Phycisphaerae bacterium]
MTKTVRIDLGERSYDVQIGSGLLEQLGSEAAKVRGVSGAVIVSDSNVAPLYADQARASLEKQNIPTSLIHIPAGEQHKTLETVGRVFDALFAADPPVDRQTLIVPLGGGVTGDLGGFVAATALRGMRFLQCPTTILADVDASVGGKTGVDHPAGKNLIGAFHQPVGVLIDTDTLRSLPLEQIRNGLAECVKHGVIRDASLLDYIEAHCDEIIACETDTLVELLARNVQIKADVVARDETESGVRAHLNFGHTIGHAIEAYGQLGEILHGQAVSLGMIANNEIAVRRGLIDRTDADRVEALLRKLGLPVRKSFLDTRRIWTIMQHDKKNRGGKVRMILPTKLGEVEIFDDTDEREVAAAVNALAE